MWLHLPKNMQTDKAQNTQKIFAENYKLRNSYWSLTNWAQTSCLAILSVALYDLLQTYTDEYEFVEGPSVILKF